MRKRVRRPKSCTGRESEQLEDQETENAASRGREAVRKKIRGLGTQSLSANSLGEEKFFAEKKESPREVSHCSQREEP